MRPPLVLAYHGLGSYPRQLDPHNLMVDPASFRSQVTGLLGRGYAFVSLEEFAAPLSRGEPPAVATCALTFDDGTLDNLEVMLPLLTELGVSATVFACPGLLGEPHFAMPAEAGVRLMDSSELAELAASPLVSIGSHTTNHSDLSSAGAEEAHAEIVRSKEALEDMLGVPVPAFAYPKCGYSPACPDAVRRAGHSVAVTCGGRGGWVPHELRRESIDPLDGRIGFALKSRGLFHAVRDSPPGRLARGIARPLRHRGAA
jgi:peptidoglycan/xylan/chitin deacetylase (PgdA/CDA1 family)